MRRIIKKTSISVLLLLIGFCAGAQEITLHNMAFLGQRHSLNPALNPTTRFYFNMIDIGFGLQNNFSMYNIRSNDDSSLSPIKFLENMKKNNTLKTDQLINFGLGFRLTPKLFLHASATQKLQARISYPYDLFSFLIKGNLHPDNVNKPLNIGGFKINGTAYIDYSVGASYQVNCKLTVGARFKYLSGIGNFYTKESKLEITTSDEYYQITTNNDLDFRYTAPDIVTDYLGEIYDYASPLNFDLTSFNPFDFLKSNNNGKGLDLGVTYLTFYKKLLLTASLIDLGYINWTDGARRSYNKAENKTFKFNGFNSKAFSEIDGDPFQTLLDTLSSTFDLVDEETSGYKTYLVPKTYLSGSFELFKGTKVGGIMYGEFSNDKLSTAWSVNAQTRVGKIINLQGNVTLMNKQISNIGLGAAFNVGPIQLWAVTNNANILFFDPFDVKTLHFRLGASLVFAYGKDNKNKCSPDYIKPTEREKSKNKSDDKKNKN